MDRRESAMQYLDTLKDLIAHTWVYLPKFPKTTRFIFQTKMNSVLLDCYNKAIMANLIFIKTRDDWQLKRNLINESIGNLASFEAILSIVIVRYKQYVSDYGWQQWGKLIAQERSLLAGVLKKLNEKPVD